MCQKLFGSCKPAVRTQSRSFSLLSSTPSPTETPRQQPWADHTAREYLRAQPGATREPGSETEGCQDTMA